MKNTAFILVLTSCMILSTLCQSAVKPDELALKVAEIYAESNAKMLEMMESKPEGKEALINLTKLYDTYAAKLVALGKDHQKLSSADVNKFELALMNQMRTLNSQEKVDKLNELNRHYNNLGEQVNYDIATEIAKFNIITQFCQYDLLKKQEPEEAKKYGIE